MILLLDLDNTIFETKTIDASIFEPALAIIINFLKTNYSSEISQFAIQELWTKPFDVVAEKYQIPMVVRQKFMEKINALDYQLDISVYPGYDFLKKINTSKILVTTGFTSLQEAKIEALGIRDDFEEIHIDDPADKNRKFKKGIFQELMQRRNLSPQNCWVIGDSADSEIAAGNVLGMKTIHRIKEKELKSPLADFKIYSFFDLEKILQIN